MQTLPTFLPVKSLPPLTWALSLQPAQPQLHDAVVSDLASHFLPEQLIPQVLSSKRKDQRQQHQQQWQHQQQRHQKPPAFDMNIIVATSSISAARHCWFQSHTSFPWNSAVGLIPQVSSSQDGCQRSCCCCHSCPFQRPLGWLLSGRWHGKGCSEQQLCFPVEGGKECVFQTSWMSPSLVSQSVCWIPFDPKGWWCEFTPSSQWREVSKMVSLVSVFLRVPVFDAAIPNGSAPAQCFEIQYLKRSPDVRGLNKKLNTSARHVIRIDRQWRPKTKNKTALTLFSSFSFVFVAEKTTERCSPSIVVETGIKAPSDQDEVAACSSWSIDLL